MKNLLKKLLLFLYMFLFFSVTIYNDSINNYLHINCYFSNNIYKVCSYVCKPKCKG